MTEPIRAPVTPPIIVPFCCWLAQPLKATSKIVSIRNALEIPLRECVERLAVGNSVDDVVMVYFSANSNARSAVGAKTVRADNNRVVADNCAMCK